MQVTLFCLRVQVSFSGYLKSITRSIDNCVKSDAQLSYKKGAEAKLAWIVRQTAPGPAEYHKNAVLVYLQHKHLCGGFMVR